MNISFSSFLIAGALWYLLITIFNLVFLYITQRIKEFDYKKILLLNFFVLCFYFIAIFISIAFFTYGLIPFVFANIIAVFIVGIISSSHYLFNETERPVVYAGFFAFFLNVVWYNFFGIF